jgi:hypothetical protein
MLTDKESEIVWHVVHHIAREYYDTLNDCKVDLEDLE